MNANLRNLSMTAAAGVALAVVLVAAQSFAPRAAAAGACVDQAGACSILNDMLTAKGNVCLGKCFAKLACDPTFDVVTCGNKCITKCATVYGKLNLKCGGALPDPCNLG